MQVSKRGIKNDAVDETKIRLSNNVALRARNAANTADVNIIKLDASNRPAFEASPYVGVKKLVDEGQTGVLIPETSVACANTQSVAADITGLVFDHSVYTSAKIQIEVRRRTASAEVFAWFEIVVFWRFLNSTWDRVIKWDGDLTGVTFSVNSSGQLQYTTDTLAGTGYTGSIKFKAVTFGA